MSDEVIWITRDPSPALEGRDIEITFTSRVRQCTYRMPRARARRFVNSVLCLLDEREPKSNNVRLFSAPKHD